MKKKLQHLNHYPFLLHHCVTMTLPVPPQSGQRMETLCLRMMNTLPTEASQTIAALCPCMGHMFRLSASSAAPMTVNRGGLRRFR